MKSTFILDKELESNQKQIVSKTGVREISASETRGGHFNRAQIKRKYGWSDNVIKQEMDSGRLESREIAGRRYSTQEQIEKWIKKI